MTNYINKSLAQGETIRSTHKPSKWMLLAPSIVFVTSLIMLTFPIIAQMQGIGAIGLFSFAVGYFIFGLIVMLTALINVYTTEYGITDKKVIAKSGLIARKVDELRLDKFEGADVNQSILGRIFGFGDVVFSGTGLQKVSFAWVPNPLEVKRTI